MKSVVVAFLLVLPAAAQEQVQAKVFEIKYADVRRIHSVLAIFPNAGLSWDETMRTITAKGGPEQLKAIEETIKRFDVPTVNQNLEFTIYLVVASADTAKSGPIPAALDPVIKQMSQTFSFKGFRLAETFMLRTRDGRSAEASSLGPARGADNQNTFYQCRFSSARVIPDEKGKNIRIDGLKIGMRVPYRTAGGQQVQYQYADIGFSTDIDVREGQKAVVGKSNLDGNEVMFAVLVPRIVD